MLSQVIHRLELVGFISGQAQIHYAADQFCH